MSNNVESKKEYQLWLDRASDDISWTESNIREKVYYGACFTAQQAVEKALKAFLLYKQNRFDKIHDLVKLVDDCSLFDEEFRSIRSQAATLSHFYVQTRYPDISELDQFTETDAHDALSAAKEIVAFVQRKIH